MTTPTPTAKSPATPTPTDPNPAAFPLNLNNVGKTTALYQRDGTLTTHESELTSLTPLAAFPAETRALFRGVVVVPGLGREGKKEEGEEKDGEEGKEKEGEEGAYLLTTDSTIFHAQGGGQPSDTGTIRVLEEGEGEGEGGEKRTVLQVHQVRTHPSTQTILHLVSTLPWPSPSIPPPRPTAKILQSIDADKRKHHSRLHTAGHALGLAIYLLSQHTSPPALPPDLKDGKASHYPSAAFVEFSGARGGVIAGDKKAVIQEKVDALVRADLPVSIAFLRRDEAARVCVGGIEGAKVGAGHEDEVEVRVVDIGGLGCYACGGTHVARLGELGRVLVRGVKRQKGVSKVGYDVVDGF